MSPDPGQQHEVAELAAGNAVLETEIALVDLERIRPLLRRDAGMARGQFRFHRENAAAVAEGHVSATLTLTCQRCLGEMTLPIDTDSRLAFVASAGAEAPASREPVIAPDGQVSLATLIEEELLLALPLAPMHGETDDCRASPESHESEPRQKPFAGLRELMKD
ncbi:MAG TPA: YceD family protein [Steroidobacteraceae bacterium]|nr:YceD family protein [Steroidobacteraceae bacterium]